MRRNIQEEQWVAWVSRKDVRLYHRPINHGRWLHVLGSSVWLLALSSQDLAPLRTDVGFSPFLPFVSGSTEKCWNLRGSCREKCIKNEKVYVFCMSGKLCCVKPKFQPKSLQSWISALSPRAQKWREPCPESDLSRFLSLIKIPLDVFCVRLLAHLIKVE